MKYFLDNCLSPKYAPMLEALAMGEVFPLRKHYDVKTPDEEWIPDLGRNEWVLIGTDREQMKKPEQRKALIANRVTAFYLAKAFDNQPFIDVAWRLVRYWPMITSMAERAKMGSIFLVQIKGGIDPLPL